MADHCTNNAADRALGKLWERAFMALAKKFLRCAVIPNQQNDSGAAVAHGPDGQVMTVADVQLLRDPNEHHEVKHKNPSRDGCYGLEEFRLESLYKLSGYPGAGEVLYTIHDWELAGGRDARVNKLSHWRTARIADLMSAEYKVRVGPTWVSGTKKDAPICYWPTSAWRPLATWWKVPFPTKLEPVELRTQLKLWTADLLEWRDDYAAAESKYWGDTAGPKA